MFDELNLPWFIKMVYLYSRLEQARINHEMLIEKLKVVTESQLSAEERASRYEQLMQEEEKHQREIEVEVKTLRNLLFRKTQELHETKTTERNNDAEIQVNYYLTRNL